MGNSLTFSKEGGQLPTFYIQGWEERSKILPRTPQNPNQRPLGALAKYRSEQPPYLDFESFIR